jgi:hypothetical protein
VSVKGRRQVKEGFLRLETIETWIVSVLPFIGWMGKTKYLSAFERGTVVGARLTGLSVSRELQSVTEFHFFQQNTRNCGCSVLRNENTGH